MFATERDAHPEKVLYTFHDETGIPVWDEDPCLGRGRRRGRDVADDPDLVGRLRALWVAADAEEVDRALGPPLSWPLSAPLW
ncbi:MAG TPA: hypothetical protein ENK18_02385 [Deltaproteobacteria bacterium]|nr:hypothetical protein [Deltaproteobacteria bacterium]